MAESVKRYSPSEGVERLEWRRGGASHGLRAVPEETPIALTYDGTAYAVMMATPADIEDFAIGFSLAEGTIGGLCDLESVEAVDVEGGIEARMWLKPAASARNRERRRAILGPTGCGLCGVESIAEALRPVRRVESDLEIPAHKIGGAMAALQARQHLHAKTRAVHGAGFFSATAAMIVREDVGRHNALDKLAGAMARAAVPGRDGVILLTSRVSVELVQKTARIGAPVMAAVSAPTALAIRIAEEAGITLVAVVRGQEFEVFSHPNRILVNEHADAIV